MDPNVAPDSIVFITIVALAALLYNLFKGSILQKRLGIAVLVLLVLSSPLIIALLELLYGYEPFLLLKRDYKTFTQDVFSLQMPDETTKIDQYEDMRNGCNGGSNLITAAMLMETNHTKEDIETFYSGKTINSVKCRWSTDKYSKVKVYFFEDGKLDEYEPKYDFLADVRHIFVEGNDKNKLYYVVFAECNVGATFNSAL